jgi:hypothetical protein
MIVADTPQSHPDCPSKNEFLCSESDGRSGFYHLDLALADDYPCRPGESLLGFQLSSSFNKLDAVQPSLFKVADNDRWKVYDYPAGYAKKYDDIDRGGGERSDVQNVFEDKQKRRKLRCRTRRAVSRP